jgi:hypothetical protein
MFNPHPRVQAVPITPRHACYVIDDALLEPERWVEYALAHRGELLDKPGNAFPGPELPLPDTAISRFAEFFARHARSPLGGRRTLRSAARLSLTTRAPGELRPWQWFCHVDRRGVPPGHMAAACVLYLFEDERLGGTSFYMPKRPVAQITALMEASASMPPAQFSAQFGIAPGYMTASNAWFERVRTIPPRWNRMIFYSGTILHSGDIRHPELLTDEPRRGRLAINGFFTCSRALEA